MKESKIPAGFEPTEVRGKWILSQQLKPLGQRNKITQSHQYGCVPMPLVTDEGIHPQAVHQRQNSTAV